MKPGWVPLQHIDTPDFTNNEVQTDFMGSFLVQGKHPYHCVLKIQEILTRYLVMIPAKNCITETVANTLAEHWICLFGVTRNVSLDGGSRFTSEVFKSSVQVAGWRGRISCWIM